jgi:hypothetical protein
LEEPDSLPDPDLDLDDLELIVGPMLAAVLNSEELYLLLFLLIFIVQLQLLFLPILVQLRGNHQTKTDKASKVDGHGETDLPVVAEDHDHDTDDYEETLRYLVEDDPHFLHLVH